MNYEQKYKEALEKARQFSEHPLQEDSSSIVEYIFPELKESEDERIRKALIRFHKSTIDVDGIKGEDIIAWLEKQKSVGEIVERCKKSWYNEGKIQGQIEGLTNDEKYQQGWHDALETVNRDKIKQGILRGAAINLIAWIDYNAAEGNMCLSNMECKGIEEAIVNGDWGKIYAYIKKKIEKQEPTAFNWSTDDKNKLLVIEQILDCANLLISSQELTEIKNWLKSLKQRIGG